MYEAFRILRYPKKMEEPRVSSCFIMFHHFHPPKRQGFVAKNLGHKNSFEAKAKEVTEAEARKTRQKPEFFFFFFFFFRGFTNSLTFSGFLRGPFSFFFQVFPILFFGFYR